MLGLRSCVVVSVFVLAACSSGDEPTPEPADRVEQAARKPCAYQAMCAEGYAWDEQSCGCRPAKAGGPGEACGSRTCAAGEVCCNASCGICTPPDGYCTMQVCDGTTAL